jgi:subtilisin family serine protease
MESIDLLNLQPLMNITGGSPQIKIGLIDGPVAIDHPSLDRNKITQIRTEFSSSCLRSDSIACRHGTFIAGILNAKRGSVAPSIAPDCNLLIRPIFSEVLDSSHDLMPVATPKDLSEAIIDCVDAGVQVINLSLAVSNPSSRGKLEIESALDYAARQGSIVVAAAGNQGLVGSSVITGHPWTIPVIACNLQGIPLRISNLGSSIGRNGFCAPGDNITSLGTSDDGFTITGTSAAVPFIAAAIALLCSALPLMSAETIKYSILRMDHRRSIVPPLMNVWNAYKYLNSRYSNKTAA